MSGIIMVMAVPARCVWHIKRVDADCISHRTQIVIATQTTTKTIIEYYYSNNIIVTNTLSTFTLSLRTFPFVCPC